MVPEQPSVKVVLAIALATPAALALETGARLCFLPPDLNQLRLELQPTLTPLAWGLFGLTCLCLPLGFFTKRALLKRFLARVEARSGGPKKRAEAHLEAMFVGTSVPQLPAVLATFALTAGSKPLPTVLSVVASALGIVAIALFFKGSPPLPNNAH